VFGALLLMSAPSDLAACYICRYVPQPYCQPAGINGYVDCHIIGQACYEGTLDCIDPDGFTSQVEASGITTIVACTGDVVRVSLGGGDAVAGRSTIPLTVAFEAVDPSTAGIASVDRPRGTGVSDRLVRSHEIVSAWAPGL